MESPRSLRRAQIQFEVSGRPFQLPVVTGTVAGERTLMLLDTGASAHVVAGWLARKTKLPLERRGDTGTDHAGKAVVTARTPRPGFVVDGWGALEDRATLVIEVPELLERLGIGAFLSPQRLGAGVVVVDLPRGELRESASLDDEKGALAAWASYARPEARSLPEARVCLDRASSIGGLVFVVPASVADQRVELLLDTGAQRTDLFTTSVAGRTLAPQAVAGGTLFAASGKITTRTLRQAELVVGEVRTRLDVDLLPGVSEVGCPRDGVLGIDALRRCVLVFGVPAAGPVTLYGRCLAAP